MCIYIYTYVLYIIVCTYIIIERERERHRERERERGREREREIDSPGRPPGKFSLCFAYVPFCNRQSVSESRDDPMNERLAAWAGGCLKFVVIILLYAVLLCSVLVSLVDIIQTS